MGALEGSVAVLATGAATASIPRPFPTPRRQPSMYVVVNDRNQQFRAEPGQRVRIPFHAGLEPGATVTFDQVCMVTGDNARIGTPFVDGVRVAGTVVGTVKGPKLVVQKIRRRKNSRCRTGFRARYTEVRIDSIDGI